MSFKQNDEFEAQIQWLISSVRQRSAKGCLVLVEVTWFIEDSVLTKLSGVADSVTGETFEILPGDVHRSWTQRGARHQREMVLKTEPQHQTSIWERLIMAAMEDAADRNA